MPETDVRQQAAHISKDDRDIPLLIYKGAKELFAKFTEKEGTRVSVFYLKNIVIDAKIYTEGRLKLGCRSFSSTFLKYFEGPIRPSKVGISLKNLEPAAKIFRIKQRVGAVFYAQARIPKGMFG